MLNMNCYGAGKSICLDFEVRDCDDALDSPATLTFTVRLPDGSTAVLVPVETGIGIYTVEIPTASGDEGQWWYTIVTTDPATEADGSFVVTPQMATV